MTTMNKTRLIRPRSRTLISLLCIMAFLSLSLGALGEDCTVSKAFEVTHQQSLSGRLYDLIGGGLEGIRLILISDQKVVRYTKTDSAGRFNFGILPNSHYYLRYRENNATLCAPEVQCDDAVCTLVGPLKRNSAKPRM